MTDKTITPPQVNQPKGSGSLEFDGLLAAFHAIVWATAEDDDPDLAYDEAGNVEAKKLQAMYRALQSELTKARELFRSLRLNADPALFSPGQLAAVDEFISNQSAPADKGRGETPNDDKSHPRFIAGYTAGLYDHKLSQGEPVAWANWKVGTKSYVPYRTEEAASRSVEYSELAATQLGPYQVVPLYATRPAPVAAVMPERFNVVMQYLMGIGDLDGYYFRDSHPSGRKYWWRNELRACLDEIGRLNSEPKP